MMEYVYAALLLHAGEKEINESNVESILKAAQYEVDSAKVKSLVASIKNINIAEAIEKAAVAPAAAAAPAASGEAAKEAEPEEDSAKKEEEAAAGLGSLFG
jgi:large subunit ribosomal protein L12